MRRGLLWPDGRLTDIAILTPPREGAVLVPVDTVPGEEYLGVLAYDAKTRAAIPCPRYAEQRALRAKVTAWAQSQKLDAYAKAHPEEDLSALGTVREAPK